MVRPSLILACFVAACGGDDDRPVPDSGPRADGGGGTDSGPLPDGGSGTDGGSTDSGPPPACGGARPVISGITGTEGLVIARDGTIYYSQDRAVGRLVPGGTPENDWVTLPPMAGTVWGLALTADNGTVYAASPSAGAIYAVDVAGASAVRWLSGVTPNGMTMGSDGNIYFGDFNDGGVYRVTGMEMHMRVSGDPIEQANGVAFGPDGRLYVDSYAAGAVYALTLTDGVETAREPIAVPGFGAFDGIAFDATGRIYITDNGRGALVRLEADGSSPMMLAPGISAAANIEFGVGALDCEDIYVASGGALFRYEMGDAAGLDVVWH